MLLEKARDEAADEAHTILPVKPRFSQGKTARNLASTRRMLPKPTPQLKLVTCIIAIPGRVHYAVSVQGRPQGVTDIYDFTYGYIAFNFAVPCKLFSQ